MKTVSKNYLPKWVRLAFLYLILVGLLGTFLRMLFFAPLEGVNYRYFLHAHSHLAFLGWVFNALFAGLLFAYIPEKAKRYRVLFWLLQIAVLGMLFSFPVQGYAAISISFTTLHVFLSWWFAVKFWKDTAIQPLEQHRLSLAFVRWSLFFMILSSLGPFALGAIMAKGLSGTPLANLAIYFYLHFQYDGWFSFAVFGLFFWILESHSISFSSKWGKHFLILMAIACMPAYALSTLWVQPSLWVYLLAFAAAILQIMAIGYFMMLLNGIKSELKKRLNKKVKWLLLFALIALLTKIILQLASAFPKVADLAYSVRNFTIGYLHIVFLGFVSVFLIAWFAQLGLLNLESKSSQKGLILFLTSFVLSELIIFLQPLMTMVGIILPYQYELLFLVSLCMPLGIGGMVYGSKART